MKITHPSAFRPSLGDRIGLLIFIIAGVAIIVWSAIATFARISAAAMGDGVSAMVRLADVTVQVPVGSGSGTIPMAVDTATVTADHVSSAAQGLAIAEASLSFAVTVAVVVCLILLAANTLRGRIFSRGNTALVMTAGMTALVGFGVSAVLEGMVGSEIVHGLSGGTSIHQALFVVSPLPFVLLAFAFGIVATAYTLGDRIERETEGLI